MSELPSPATPENTTPRSVAHEALLSTLQQSANTAIHTLRRKLLPPTDSLAEPLDYYDVEGADVALDIYSPHGWPHQNNSLTYGYPDHPAIKYFAWTNSAAGKRVLYRPPHPTQRNQPQLVIVQPRTTARWALETYGVDAKARHITQVHVFIHPPGFSADEEVEIALFRNAKTPDGGLVLVSPNFMPYETATVLLEACRLDRITSSPKERALMLGALALDALASLGANDPTTLIDGEAPPYPPFIP